MFHLVLLAAAFLCSLVAGFLFAFAVVVMPGIRSLEDNAFIRTFQVIDRVIQRNHPLFILVWVGSALSVVAAALLGLGALGGIDRLLMIAAALVYLFGVQLPTVAVNIPLNNRLKQLNAATMDATASTRARDAFERRWNRSNVARTVAASIASLLLAYLLLRV
jgi:uncharacterized membrane protein